MKKISEKPLFEGHWLSIHEMVYETKSGGLISWETVRRQKSKAGVVVIAKLIPSQKIIFIKQFRPAIDGYILGFPAGLADGDPQHALVELKEETGYTGKVVYASPILKTGSSIIDDNGRMVYVEVDEKDPANANPRQALEPGEDIEVVLVKKEEVKDFLLEQNKQGIYVASNLWYLFILSELIS
jgi:ADP-ribose pyrophosphatase